MRTNDKVILRQIGSHYMIVMTSEGNDNMTEVLSLNASAAWLWTKASGLDFSPEMLAGWLCDEYDIDMATAISDVNDLLDVWRRHGLIMVVM